MIDSINEIIYQIIPVSVSIISEPNRTIMNSNIDLSVNRMVEENSWKWLAKRFISMDYFALVKYDE